MHQAKPIVAALCLYTALVTAAGREARAAGAVTDAPPGYDAWLRHQPITDAATRERYRTLPARVVVLPLGTASPVMVAAQGELARGLQAMLGVELRVAERPPGQATIVLGTFAAVRRTLSPLARLGALPPLGADGYLLRSISIVGQPGLLIAAPNDRGVLYGVFALLRKLALGEPVDALDERRAPQAPVRMLDQWDNLDGTIERGYAGPSIFFEGGAVAADLARVRDYARLMASVGINACAINNVNADARLITAPYLPQLERVAEAFRPWGVRLFVSIDFSSPRKVGGLDTFDPLDPRVVAWWRALVRDIYRAVPDFGGFVLKADSEGRLGPSAYGRTHADAANVIARALRPHGGAIFYRGFIYDHHLDWRNPRNDRARAAYDNLHGLDGRFDGGVVLQIKHGPIDFQVREPVSPLFGGLARTNQAVELQITQEYTGQQRHLCFLVPMWKEILDFDMRLGGARTPVKELVAGKTFRRPSGGLVGVANVGRDATWLGHHLAMANLYGFGRLAFDPALSAERIAAEWTGLTFGADPRVAATVVRMLMGSWATYEKYTGPLGAGTLTDILHGHYGPAPASSEENGWGQWHRADHDGVGMDRTVATGTGFIGQYPADVARTYEALASCPDELLLFMHHVPYSHVLHSGKTVIQHIYDSHYDGAAEAEELVARWRSLRGAGGAPGAVDARRFDEVLRRLEYQAGHARVWRDAITGYFRRLSGIADARGRVGRSPAGRVEAEAMTLRGYRPTNIVPEETASGGRAVSCVRAPAGGATVDGGTRPPELCTARFVHAGGGGRFDIAVQYFDPSGGVARFRMLVAGRPVDQWAGDDGFPTTRADGQSSTRRLVPAVALAAGDEIRIEGVADGEDAAAIDFVDVAPARP